MEYDNALNQLKSFSNPDTVEGTASFGINSLNSSGVPSSNLKKIAKEIGKNHLLAQQLWASRVHEARILASMIDDPEFVTEGQLESWVKDFDSWDVCYQCCINLFYKTKFAYQKAIEWSVRGEEFVKIAGFVLMAELATYDKKAKDDEFQDFLPIIKTGSTDSRSLVRKAVSLALRQIGKRSLNLNKKAIEIVKEIQKMGSKNADWVAYEAFRELTSDKIQGKLRK